MFAPPAALSAHFTAGQLAPAPVVVRLGESYVFGDGPRLLVYTAAADRAHGVAVIEAIMADAEGAKNLFRGRALTATEHDGLVIEVADLPSVRRSDVTMPEHVWAEIDLNVAALTTHRELMSTLGLGVRRGVLLAGPPGVGKTAISHVIAGELLGRFTVIAVDARAGQSALAGLYKEARTLGPTLIILEDIDLIVADRRKQLDSRALSEFLAVMDTDPSAPILTLASTNDVTTLDAASIRIARFDWISKSATPTMTPPRTSWPPTCAGVPGAGDVSVSEVAAYFGPETSGADIREIVRRTVLSTGAVTEPDLVAAVRSGRFKAYVPQGNYL